MSNPERKEFTEDSINMADASGYSEKKTDLNINRKMGRGLSSANKIVFSKKSQKKKKGS